MKASPKHNNYINLVLRRSTYRKERTLADLRAKDKNKNKNKT